MKQCKALLAAALSTLVLAAGCSNVLQEKPAQNTVAGGKGTVQVRLGSPGRTVLPDTAQLYYALAFTAGAKTETAAIGLGETAGTVYLEPGTWGLEVKGYLSKEDAETNPGDFVASGTATVTVISGQATPVTVGLALVAAETGAGVLSYTIRFPDGLDAALLKLIPITGAGTLAEIDLSNGTVKDGVMTKSAALPLAAGYWRLSLRFSRYDSANDVSKSAAKTRIFHIYGDLTTEVSESFGDEDFTEQPTFSSITDLAAYLQSVPSRSRDNPYAAALRDVSLTKADPDPMVQIFAALGGKYVALDLSGCTGTAIATTTAAASARGTLVSLVLPDTVESIGDYAFYNCGSLVSVELPAELKSIGNYAFQNCYALTSVEPPAELQSIGSYAFTGSYSLTQVLWPESAENAAIGNNAFQNCYALSRLELPENLVSIGNTVFSTNQSLRSVRLPPKLTTLGTNVFQNSPWLMSVELPDTLTGIIPNIFTGCTALNSLSLYSPDDETPGSLNVAAEGKILIAGDTLIVALASLSGEVLIPADIKSIGSSAFANNPGVTAVNWPEAPAEATIRDTSFNGMPALRSVVLPPTLTTVGRGAFGQSPALETVVMPSATSLGDQAFSSNTALASINATTGLVNANPGLCKLPDNLVAIGSNVITNSQITSIVLGPNVATIGTRALVTNTVLTSVDMSGCTMLTKFQNAEFSGCAQLSTVTLPPNLETLTGGPFVNCPLIISLALPNTLKTFGNVGVNDTLKASLLAALPPSVTAIDDNAFSGCAALTSITVPSGVKSIGRSAFMSCPNLTSVTLPEGLETIGSFAFQLCSNLNTINFPNGLTAIDDYAFVGCGFTSLELPATLKTIGFSSFERNSLVYVKWHAAPPDATIDTYAFDCASLKWVELPATLTSIAQAAFTNNTGTAEALELVIVRNAATVPAIQAGSFPPAANNPSLKFYVPDAKVADYKAAANWSSFAAKIDSLNNLPPGSGPDDWTVTP